MKKFSSIILALCLIVMLNSRMHAQDVRLVKTKVADMLMQLPAKNEAEVDRLMAQTVYMGDEALSELFGMLKAPGAGNDVAVRYALTSLARYSSRKGYEQDWAWLQSNFLRAIQANTSKEVQAYLIEQLIYGADDLCVDALSRYLRDPFLCGPVTSLFFSIGTEKACNALLEALPTVPVTDQITIVKTLGELNYKAAVPAIIKLEGSANIELQRAVLMALADVGSAETYDLLWDAAKKAEFTDEPAGSTAAFLTYCDRLGADNQLKLCKKACLALIKANKAGKQLHNQAAALRIYSRYFQPQAMPLLLKAAKNPDRSFRMAVLDMAKDIQGVSYTAQWIKLAEKEQEPVTADIIFMLGERADQSSLHFVEQCLESQYESVRTEAIWALVKLNPQMAATDLISHMSSGKDVVITEMALKTLLDEKDLDKVAVALQNAVNQGKPGLINLIAAKSGKRYFTEIFHYTGSEDTAIRNAAISALKNIASPADTEKLIQLLLQVENKEDIKQLQQAIAEVTVRQGDAETALLPVLQAMEKSSRKDKFLPVLSQVGGNNALRAMGNLYNVSEGQLRSDCFNALVSWNGPGADSYLYEICKSGNPEFREGAFKGFINQIRSSKMYDDQKLLKLQMIMPFAKNPDEKALVLDALSGVRTFLSLVYLEKYLDDPELQQVAARSAAVSALPETGIQNGFYGEIPKRILMKIIEVINGSESEYIKEKIRRYLEVMPAEQGFVSMFNGTDLSGWKGYITDPVKLALLTESEKTRKQLEADKKMADNWSVRDGMIVFNGDGNNILSQKEFGDFELFVNWRIRKKGDSGIYLRGTPQVQIWDTSRVEVGAQVGSGGLYNNQKNPSKPLKVADNPVDEWNTFHIFMIGEKVTVYLNGELVVDNTVLENYWDRNIPIFPKGTVELQAHGTDLAFKDIYIREISFTGSTLLPQEKSEGFESLFNGRNLDGWVGDKVNYMAKDGMIIIEPGKGSGGGNLFTEKEYSDFNFRFEFQLTPNANNGLGIRAPLEGDAAYVGMELQILDNEAPMYSKLEPYQYHGSVYGVIPAKRGFLKPTGEWNTEEVIVKGKKVKVILNGTVILDGDIAEASRNGTMDHNEHPGLLRDKGHIGFLGHGSVVKFRNIRIKNL